MSEDLYTNVGGQPIPIASGDQQYVLVYPQLISK
jgi:hypothetical protein